MCSHDGCCYNAKVIDYYAHTKTDNRFVSFLPMNHIAVTVYIARPDALRGSLLNTLQLAQPTLFVAVPRVWEKFADKLKASFAEASVVSLPLCYG